MGYQLPPGVIYRARKKKKMTQEHLANLLGVKRSVISKYETGRVVPSVEQAQKISNFLDIPFLELLGLDPESDNISERELLENLILKHFSEHKDFDLSKLDKLYFFDENGLRFEGDNALFDKLVLLFDSLNDDGRYEAVKRIEELTEIPRYRRQESPEPLAAPPGDTDTPTPPEGAEGPQTPPEGG